MEPLRGHSTLILGAGASAAYGFPSGRGLKNRIVGSGSLRRTLRDCGFEEIHVRAFLKELRSSRLPTIDQFLQRNKDFEELGKVAIAAALIPFEREAALTPINPRDDWYRLLFEALCAQGEFEMNNLSIITLNYERSLERYLFRAAKAHCPHLSDRDISMRMGNRIHHYHGMLGALPELPSMVWSDTDFARPYECRASLDDIRRAAQNIMVLHEQRRLRIPTRALTDGRSTIYRSRLVAFLGFGYHPQVLEDLGCAQLIASAYGSTTVPQPEYYGSAYHLAEADRERAIAAIPGMQLAPSDSDIVDVIQCFSLLDTRLEPPVENVPWEDVLDANDAWWINTNTTGSPDNQATA